MDRERGKRRATSSRPASSVFAVGAAVMMSGCGNSGSGQSNRTPAATTGSSGGSATGSRSGPGSSSSSGLTVATGGSGSTGSSGSAGGSGAAGSGSGGSSTGKDSSSSSSSGTGSGSSGGASSSGTKRGAMPTDGGAGSSGSGPTSDSGANSQAWATVHNDFFWYDDTGTLIQVRSGALRQFNGTYYWYGSQPGGIDQTCYASTDLVHWTYKGVSLVTAALCDRMDVLYNDTTKQYVMFLKYDGDKASFGTATASAPEGPYTFLGDTLVDGNYIGDMSMYKDDDGKAYLAYV